MTTAKETTRKEVGEVLAHVVEHMATKEDVADLRNEIADLRKTMVTKDYLKSWRRTQIDPARSR